MLRRRGGERGRAGAGGAQPAGATAGGRGGRRRALSGRGMSPTAGADTGAVALIIES